MSIDYPGAAPLSQRKKKKKRKWSVCVHMIQHSALSSLSLPPPPLSLANPPPSNLSILPVSSTLFFHAETKTTSRCRGRSSLS